MYRADCTYFDGYKPCSFQKKDKALECNDKCPFYTHKKRAILLKKGAIGEVLRCTVLFNYLKDYELTILTDYPEIINKSHARHVYKYNLQSYIIIKNQEYDLLLSLDKEPDMSALANQINARVKKGFYLDANGKIMPIDSDAEYLWKRGIDDNFMKTDPKNYSQLIIETCGFKYSGNERYVMPEFEKKELFRHEKQVVGFNTGASRTWQTRIWPDYKWISLAKNLSKRGYEIILLGGPDEDDKNKRLAKETGARYFGVVPFSEFINIVDNCDIVVTAVTFAFHVAAGLGKSVILFNNIFPKNEFRMPNVTIVEPNLPCVGCYKSRFDKNCHVQNCMELIDIDRYFE